MRSALEAGAEGLAKSGPSVGAPGATFLDDTEADPVFPKKESDGFCSGRAEAPGTGRRIGPLSESSRPLTQNAPKPNNA